MSNLSNLNQRIEVISICSLSHAPVWKLTSKLILRFLGATDYVVYVPEAEIQRFREITPREIRVQSQNELDAKFSKDLSVAVENSDNAWRYGWYAQQFMKIEAMRKSDAEIVVIWDADCVPTKRIPLLDSQGNPKFMSAAKEIHLPYFEMIERLLGLPRIQDISFVVPAFPFKREWIEDFIDEIQLKNGGRFWALAMLQNIDFRLMSGFSETETLGTWMVHRKPASWSQFPGTWERRGQKRFGYAKNISDRKIIKIGAKLNLDIISFENWDTRGFKLVLKRLKELVGM